MMANLETRSTAATPPPPTAAPPDGPTTQAAATPTNAGAVPSTEPGPIPFPQHKQILENSRKAFDSYRQQHGWAEQVPQAKLQEFAGIAQRMTADPVGFLNEFQAQLLNHPTYGPQLRSTAGKTLATPQSGPPAADVQIINDKGQVVGMTYSDKAQAEKDAYEWAQRESQFKQMIAPLVSERETRIREQEIQAFQTELHSSADRGMSQIDQILDGRTKELGPHVAQLMADRPDLEPVEAALEIRKQMIVPRQTEQAKAQVLDTMNKKANGNTANGSGAVATPMRPKNRAELATMLAALEN